MKLSSASLVTFAFGFGIGLSSCANHVKPVTPEQRSGAPAAEERILRSVVSEELEKAAAEWSPKAALAVVMDVDTGRVVAMDAVEAGAHVPDLAKTRTFVTGSTLKTLLIAAAIDEGVVTPTTVVDCAGPRKYPDGELEDASPNGAITVARSLAVSSNVGASRVLDALGLPKFAAAFQRFHLGEPPASRPSVVDASSLRAAEWAGGELARATPLQLATAYTAIYGRGELRMPSFDAQPSAPERVLRTSTAATMVAMLEGVVSDGGTGKRARVPGLHVIGKTGTAAPPGEPRYASFVGTVLGQRRSYVMLVGLEAPKGAATGGDSAAPVFARIAARIFTP